MHAFELFPGSRIGIRRHSHKNRKCFKINNIAISVIERKKLLKLDDFSREFKDLFDSPLLPIRFYLIHPQHFVQIYPASQGPQKSSRFYLCSLLLKNAN